MNFRDIDGDERVEAHALACCEASGHGEAI